MKPDGELGRNHSHVAKFQHEVAVPGAAIVLAVRDQLESELFLQSHHLANRGVLYPLELGIRDLAFVRLFAWPDERGGSTEASHLLGSEGGRGMFQERFSLRTSFPVKMRQ